MKLKKKKKRKKLSNEYFQIVIAKTVSITGMFSQRNLLNSLIHSPLHSIFKCS